MLVLMDGGNATFPRCANDDIGDRRQPRWQEVSKRAVMGGARGFIRFLS